MSSCVLGPHFHFSCVFRIKQNAQVICDNGPTRARELPHSDDLVQFWIMSDQNNLCFDLLYQLVGQAKRLKSVLRELSSGERVDGWLVRNIHCCGLEERGLETIGDIG